MTELVFALDTTSERGSLALARLVSVTGDVELLEEAPLHSRTGFSDVLYGEIERLLFRHNLRVEDVSSFAVANGPGSFTGVRVGLACVKGLAEAAGKPVVGVSNLEVMAAFGTAKLRAAALDARRGEAYCSFAGIEVVTRFPDWLETLPDGVEIVSTDFTPFRAALEGSRFSHLTQAPPALAGAVARIAARKYRAGEAVDPAALDANYVRRCDAEMMWKES
ncbi:MAG: tRNA (adenosine(37)-N6)-threonylcarbamoyltransferase complex dimerization subunit type 1 TsaB [Bryobacterales bacterium]|nr:tRNA (adenosine(37)-N6)-threonylcarbamoyltransferase complex dimerization subunit type 1 TsaB [Bryobacterales bacterium]